MRSPFAVHGDAFSHSTHVLAFALASLCAASSQAAIAINGGTHFLLPNSRKTIAVAVSGGEQVIGLNFVVQIGDGGSLNGGNDQKPSIVSGDIIGPGTIFSGNNVGDQPAPFGGLIWCDSTLIDPRRDSSVTAQGTLAYLTIDTSGMSASATAYPLRFQNVAAQILGGSGLQTDFVDLFPTILDGTIYITDYRALKWSADANGNWTDPVWNGSPPVFPDYTANATIDKPYMVAVRNVQETNSLTLKNGAELLIDNDSAYLQNSLTVYGATAIDVGSRIEVKGTLNTRNISLQGLLQVIDGGTVAANVIEGQGAIEVGDGSGSSALNAMSIAANSLAIGGTDFLASNSSHEVPEPGTFHLFACFLLLILGGHLLRQR
jgi:hypothetical protein